MAALRLHAPVVMVAALILIEPVIGAAQDRANPTRDDAVLVVDGVVREVFQSPRRGRVDFIVQVEVKRSEAIRAPRTASRVPVPAPGDLVYVHASQRHNAALGLGGSGTGQPLPRDSSAATVPAERSQVRVFLAPRASGGWEGAGSPWFDLTSRELADAGASDPPPVATERPPELPGPRRVPTPDSSPAGRSALVALGLTGEAMTVQGKFVVRVSSVEPSGPSQRAGLEPGDIIIGLNDKPLTGIEQLDALAQQGGRCNLAILDVNTGKTVRVPVDVRVPTGRGPLGKPPVAGEERDTPVLAGDAANRNPRAPARTLGVSAEPVTIGQRTAMKVVGVQPDSPGQKAGLEPGDVIVTANGVPITGAEALSAVVRKSGATVSLTVRDTRTGKDTRVDVKLGGDEPGNLTPAPADSAAPSGPGRRLGAVTEVVFYDIDPAVKVTEVEPGSAAALAGIEPGDVIVEANGSPVLHPKELDELVRKSGPTLKLMVVDPRTRQKSAIEVKLGAER
jgi:serine protease Do